MSLSTHVLDTVSGRPAAGLAIMLQRLIAQDQWHTVASGSTDQDGRLSGWVPADQWRAGRYRLRFDVASYHGPDGLYPEVLVVFQVADPQAHLHLPLLLSRFGYTTYRGS